MSKRAPPVLDNHHKVGRIPEQGNTQRAIELAIKNPVKPVRAQVVPGSTCGIYNLVVVAVTVRDSGRDKIPVWPNIHGSHVFQMDPDQQDSE